MARDYFQDIVPPQDGSNDRRSIPINTNRAQAPVAPAEESSYVDPDEDDLDQAMHVTPPVAPVNPPRSIRNISMSRPRPRPVEDMRDRREVPPIGMGGPHAPRRRSRPWIWGIAAVATLVLGGLLLLALRNTVVTVTPRTHTVVFDQSTQFIAYPEGTAATGTLAYTVQTVDLEDSDVAPSSGTVHAEDKASGTITVYNEYSASPVKLLATTRFQTSDGLIFRAPDQVIVPGKTGSTPGHITITVVADQAGAQYNIGPVSRFTLPGLKSSTDMYAGVYGVSTASTTGGFSGDRPGVSPEVERSTVSAIRARLEQKARDAVTAQNTDSTSAFYDLSTVSYEDEPSTSEAGGSVRLHEKVHVQIPVFPALLFAQTIAASVSADAEGASLRLVPGTDFATHPIQSASSTTLGVDALQFTANGTAELIWNVDSAQLSRSLAGRDQGAFQTVVNGFPGIQEAHARIEPFWSSTFPKDPASISIKVVTPNSQ